MSHLRLSRLASIAVVCGALLLAWALGGIMSVNHQIQLVAATPSAAQTRFVVDQDHDRFGSGHGGRGHF